MTGQKTYWHLEAQKRAPSLYDIATSRLHYYSERGFEVNTPAASWYEKYQTQSGLQCPNWEAFRDPRETTYSTYTEMQRRRESHVDQIFSAIGDEGFDQTISEGYRRRLDAILPQIRFVFHAQEMLAAYVGQMAPSGRITIAAAFQAADEVRRIQRVAYRVRQIQLVHPNFAVKSKSVWTGNEEWQPLRAHMERLFVTYDWGEAFVALCLATKPAVDDLLLNGLAKLARANGDFHFSSILKSLYEDSLWHHAWANALVEAVVAENPLNHAFIAEHSDAYRESIQRAIAPLDSLCAPALH